MQTLGYCWSNGRSLARPTASNRDVNFPEFYFSIQQFKSPGLLQNNAQGTTTRVSAHTDALKPACTCTKTYTTDICAWGSPAAGQKDGCTQKQSDLWCHYHILSYGRQCGLAAYLSSDQSGPPANLPSPNLITAVDRNSPVNYCIPLFWSSRQMTRNIIIEIEIFSRVSILTSLVNIRSVKAPTEQST